MTNQTKRAIGTFAPAPMKTESWEKEFDEAMRLFAYKYSSELIENAYGVSKTFLDEQFKKLFSSLLTKERAAAEKECSLDHTREEWIEAKIAAAEASMLAKALSVVPEKRESDFTAIDELLERYMDGWNAAVEEIKKNLEALDSLAPKKEKEG